MRAHHGVALAAAAALAVPPAGSAAASPKAPVAPGHVIPRFVVSALGFIDHPSTVDVTHAAATIGFRVQVQDHDMKFDPKSVSLVVVATSSGTPSSTVKVVVPAHLTGRSAVVSTWRGSFTVPKGAAPGRYCLTVVKVDPPSAASLPVTARAKRLAGRDCITVVNSALSAG